MSAHNHLPTLYVEGYDDVGLINSLLLRNGLDTKKGEQHLFIKPLLSIEKLLNSMPDAIRANTEYPVGFVLDIDIEIVRRWQAVSEKLRAAGATPPQQCPVTGYCGKLPDYRHNFGVWLMPDCTTDAYKLEHLVKCLIEPKDPLWGFAQNCVGDAAQLVDAANSKDNTDWQRFRDVDRIKAEVRTWLAWQRVPGTSFGAAVNDRILRHDSAEALQFLRWIKSLFSFGQLLDSEKPQFTPA